MYCRFLWGLGERLSRRYFRQIPNNNGELGEETCSNGSLPMVHFDSLIKSFFSHIINIMLGNSEALTEGTNRQEPYPYSPFIVPRCLYSSHIEESTVAFVVELGCQPPTRPAS